MFICYPKCSTCKKAEKFLKDNNINYESRDIKLDNPTKEELDCFVKLSGKDVKTFFNTSGLVYKELGLKDKLPDMSYDEKLRVLSTNGMLVKRPLLLPKIKYMLGLRKKSGMI